ncbi:MAG: hypothetical protein ABS46_00640 [Cytophagaceae bacterium SCN 52-12]|nr:MAG: hypothetical protein ABS46_00640 [Cytophagaceae bacterium SCN 52-12]
MKLLLPTVSLILLVAGVTSFQPFRTTPANLPDLSAIAMCGTVTGGEAGLSDGGRYIAALPGWGHHSYPVATESDSSQFFFDQGLSLYYGYHFKEAVASFRESARFDPDNAMAYWGQALAMGPYYNSAHLYTKPAGIGEVLVKMNRKAVKSPANEVRLVAAMNKRYSEDPADRDRAALNAAYAEAMKSLADMDDEAKILYVDAVMLMHPWDFWDPDGTAKPWTPGLIGYTTDVLRNNPQHPAALHYYIHLTEASRRPEVALESAHTLKDLMPGVPHMVHMASHGYERNGLYPQGVAVNIKADSNLAVYDRHAKHLGLNTASSHYFAVQTYCAFSGGMYDEAIRYAGMTRKSVAPSPVNTYDQYLYMLPVMARVRLGKWNEILGDTAPVPADWAYAGLLSHFARGLASAYTGDIPGAAAHLGHLREKLSDPTLKARRIPFNSTEQTGKIAEALLEGIVLYARQKPGEALEAMEKAVQLEDRLIHTEPKDWPVPSRQFLGAYLLRESRHDRAADVYRADLAKNPGNGWSLTGLQQSLEAARRRSEAAALAPRIQTAFSGAGATPPGSVYME